MSAVDVYRVTDRLEDSVLETMAKRLEARGQHPRFARMLNDYLDAMQIDSARSVLDLGCGTGVAARAIARRGGFAGTVTGVDLSSYLVAVATRLALQEGISQRTQFHVGDTHSLALQDEAFDALVAHTLLTHVEDPLVVLREAARLVRRGGMVGVFDGDFASLTFSSDDAATGRQYDEAIISATVTHPLVMRQLPQLLQAVGLELQHAFSYVVADIGQADYWLPAIESFVTLVPQSGALSEVQIRAWADMVLRHSQAGVFFASCNFYAYVARKP